MPSYEEQEEYFSNDEEAKNTNIEGTKSKGNGTNDDRPCKVM